MWLRFIGENNTWGLTKGTVYYCKISTMGGHIWVSWKDNSTVRPPNCVYKTFKELLSEWEEADEED